MIDLWDRHKFVMRYEDFIGAARKKKTPDSELKERFDEILGLALEYMGPSAEATAVPPVDLVAKPVPVEDRKPIPGSNPVIEWSDERYIEELTRAKNEGKKLIKVPSTAQSRLIRLWEYVGLGDTPQFSFEANSEGTPFWVIKL